MIHTDLSHFEFFNFCLFSIWEKASFSSPCSPKAFLFSLPPRHMSSLRWVSKFWKASDTLAKFLLQNILRHGISKDWFRINVSEQENEGRYRENLKLISQNDSAMLKCHQGFPIFECNWTTVRLSCSLYLNMEH